MCVCVFIYVFMHTYAYTHIFIYEYVHACIDISMRTCAHACIHDRPARMHTNTHACRTHIHAPHTRTHVHTYIHAGIVVCVHAWI